MSTVKLSKSLFFSYPKRGFSFTYPCPRKLREIMKVSAVEKETPETIEMIWREYHNAKGHTVSRVLSQTLYMQLMTKYQYFLCYIDIVLKMEKCLFFLSPEKVVTSCFCHRINKRAL